MSTIRVDDVGPSAGGTTKSLVRGTASAWVNFNGTGTIAARDSLNVSSLTDDGTALYTVNFTNAFSAVDYAIAGFCGNDAAGSDVSTVLTKQYDEAANTTSAANFAVITTAGQFADVNLVAASIHGDLA
jgi:hypothetical protein